LDHRSSVRAVRALADGEDAFVSALERAADPEAAGFESFLTRHQLRDAEEAVVLMERPRRSPGNRLWFRRVDPRSPSRYWAWRLTRDLAHALARLQPSRGFVLPES
jgi:hypothetical protein